MWYFSWVLGTLLACGCGIITALALEQAEAQSGSNEKS